MGFPPTLQINAWDDSGHAATGPPGPGTGGWAGKRIDLPPQGLLPGQPADPWDFRHPDVGWGLVLPDRNGPTPAEKARAEDAPEPIRRLVRERGDPAPVFRFDPGAPLWSLRRDYADGASVPFSLVGSRRGTGPDRLPRYLLIYASPDEVPWDFQYRLQAVAYVGRLDLEGDELGRYVDTLLDGWSASRVDPRSAVVWTVDHDPTDITHLMRRAIADPIASALAADPDLSLAYAGDGNVAGQTGPATAQSLIELLRTRRPALVVTTSHGLTGPLDDVPAMATRLGMPVDAHHEPLPLDAVVAESLGDGAIWYSHACCSAGASARSAFAGLVEQGSDLERILAGVAAVGNRVAPLPRRLLGCERPCRAFIGHVEPTFDWTLRQPMTGQLLADSTREALYRRIYQFRPVAWALEVCHAHGPQLELLQRQAIARLDEGDDTLDELLAYRLTAQDRESLVILGDPTAALPAVV